MSKTKTPVLATSVSATREKQAQRLKEIKAKAKAAEDAALRKFAMAVLEAATPEKGRALNEAEIVAAVKREAERANSGGKSVPMPAAAAEKKSEAAPELSVQTAQAAGAVRLPHGAQS